MSFVGLQDRLTALQESTGQLEELVDRLANLTFQPGSVPLGTDEEDSVSGELSAEIGQILKANAEDQELLLEEANYLRPEGHEKERLVEGVVRAGGEITKHRLAFRKARLQAKKSLVEAQKLERRLILKSYSAPVPELEQPVDDADDELGPAAPAPQQQQYQHHHHRSILHQGRASGLTDEDQQTVGASSNVTAALRRTHDLIASELGRSEFAHQTLTESSAALRQLDDSYGSLDSMLGKSRELLGTLLRSQKSDTWYLQTAFYMLAVTTAWLVFRRLLYGPIWWLVLFPLRILFGVGSTATRAILPAGGGKSAPAGSGAVGGATDDSQVPVRGIPDESLPTAKVDAENVRDKEDEAVREAVEKVVKHAVEEVEASEAAAEEVASETAEDSENQSTNEGESSNASSAETHEKDEL
ncbi:hypothetical protein PWT90_09686 [Aphanocladium album]|nr:hypothetical protein PWT90_09686 [Aphanocladium album]